ncbi:unnamed protein product [Didymodactylos carnosus]|uniref:Translation initiation factor eIF2B subunit epsilon n=1 Tax=Didymodactylos carnosus TaxID=1234261 RepID=A0A814KFW8_9BILA|nr:unnamed protein product [Didymodactylos carnosus]CAF1050483.1 unnamed protein product [Didymodactylos carnosus]CAF3550595.1 unnamed protein product [Didymodactylos carnosus]CAF3820204.1 unnamed protein product [Didymodactylos carnosus]
MRPLATNSDYREEERLTCVLVLDTFNAHLNDVISHTTLPLCLWPIDGQPLIDYTIYTLIRSGIQEIILVSTAHTFEIRSYMLNSQWTKTYSCNIQLVPCKHARSLGDCLRDLDQRGFITNDFLLLYGSGCLLTNQKLSSLFQLHKDNVKQDKNCVMTLVYRTLHHVEHSSLTDDTSLILIKDKKTNRLYDYIKQAFYQQQQSNSPSFHIPLELFERNACLETLYCPLDLQLSICSPDVLTLFSDNFDFLTINDFVKGVLRDEEIAFHTVYCHLYETGYFLSVHNLHLYMKASIDIIRRWTFPLVPETLALLQKTSQTISSPSSSTISLPTTSPVSTPIALQTRLFWSLYPVVYDKRNIYKQGVISLDRDSHLEIDVYIGNGTQILSNVYLKQTVIGQNCKNSRISNSIIWNHVQIEENCQIDSCVICDNVLIRSGCQLGKQSILCKGVIIGTKVVLNDNTIIVASSINTNDMGDQDEVEIDTEATARRTRRTESMRLSDKSSSTTGTGDGEKFCDTKLVGQDGLGQELLLNILSDDDDDDETEQEQRTLYNAWGTLLQRRNQPANNGSDTDTESDVNIKTGNKLSKQFASSGDVASGDIRKKSISSSLSSDPNGSIHSESATSSEDEDADVNEFQREVLQSLKRGYEEKPRVENLIVELNMLKPTYVVSQNEFIQSITRCVFLLPREVQNKTSTTPNYFDLLIQTLTQTTVPILKNYVRLDDENSQLLCLQELENLCLDNLQTLGTRIHQILDFLYDQDVFAEKWILKWYDSKKLENEAKTTNQDQQHQQYWTNLKTFVNWLKTADEED